MRRYVLGSEFDLKAIVTDESVKYSPLTSPRDTKTRKEVKDKIKTLFEAQYKVPAEAKDEKATSADFFFKKLKF